MKLLIIVKGCPFNDILRFWTSKFNEYIYYIYIKSNIYTIYLLCIKFWLIILKNIKKIINTFRIKAYWCLMLYFTKYFND